MVSLGADPEAKTALGDNLFDQAKQPARPR
jgi:hypothetical protein